MLARTIKASQLFPTHDKLIENGIVNLTYEMKRAQIRFGSGQYHRAVAGGLGISTRYFVVECE